VGDIEKRQYKRITQRFVIRFRLRTETGAGGWNMATCIDLSAGGVLFNFDHPLEAGTELDFKIDFPAAKEPILCVGKILRVETKPDSFLCRVAVIFTDIDDAQKALMARGIEDMTEK